MQQIWSVVLILQAGCSASFTQELDWSSKDWDDTKAKTKEEANSLMDCNMPKPQTDIDQKMDVDEIPFSKLQIRLIQRKNW